MQKKDFGTISQKPNNYGGHIEIQSIGNKRKHLSLVSFSLGYHVLCIAVTVYLLSVQSYDELSSTRSSSVYSFLAFTCIMYVLQLLLENKVLRWFLFIEYFYVLILGYIFPEVLYLEYLFIPAILIRFVLFFPFKLSIVFFLFGAIGAVGLSSSLIFKSYIVINGTEWLVSILGAYHYLQITVLLIMFVTVRSGIESKEKIIIEMVEQNKRMNMVNRNVSEKLFSIQQDSSLAERLRIVKEIHDSVGYIFVNIIMLMQAALAIIPRNRTHAEKKINDALDYTRRGMNEIRHILREMRAYEKPSQGLQNELCETASLFSRATGVKVKMSYGNWKRSYGQKLDSFFISFLQEGFTNALKHGFATIVEMSCWETDRKIIINIQDNGKGAPIALQFGIGILSIKEFVELYNGQVDIISSSKGFNIRVMIPNPPTLSNGSIEPDAL